MLYKTHLLFSFLISLFLIDYLNIQQKYLFIFIVLIGSLIPDIDIPSSKIGQKVKLFSFLANKIFSHRSLYQS